MRKAIVGAKLFGICCENNISKVCRNGSFHLRGNVYVHYKQLDSALLAYNTINGRYFAGKQVLHSYLNYGR
ncbi:zinc finger CCCH domain-containing protein 5-like isoform X2 [Senna tora]|uniref:Zinc finger CCCH domain-containing protein 5-like isoform X2 n=1 Tax=Senna tora TaxID=362788 RepID=A0A834SH50_9FABA|nr:zinc finger CCCH domain-containing protein 5-like isoform X2 [Senna tora]